MRRVIPSGSVAYASVTWADPGLQKPRVSASCVRNCFAGQGGGSCPSRATFSEGEVVFLSVSSLSFRKEDDGCPPPDRTKSNKQPLATQVTRATIPLPPTSRRGDATGRAIPAPGSSWQERGCASPLFFAQTTEPMGSNTPRLLKRHGSANAQLLF